MSKNKSDLDNNTADMNICAHTRLEDEMSVTYRCPTLRKVSLNNLPTYTWRDKEMCFRRGFTCGGVVQSERWGFCANTQITAETHPAARSHHVGEKREIRVEFFHLDQHTKKHRSDL